MDKPHSCPFCGENGRVVVDSGGYRVCCEKCFANSRLSTSEEAAIKVWNKRFKGVRYEKQ